MSGSGLSRYWPMTNRHQYCSERTCRKRDTRLLSRALGRRRSLAGGSLSEGPVLPVPNGVLNQVHDGRVSPMSELFTEAKPAVGVFHYGVEGPAGKWKLMLSTWWSSSSPSPQEGAIRGVRTSLPTTSQLVIGLQYQPCFGQLLELPSGWSSPWGYCFSSSHIPWRHLGAELGSKFKWPHMPLSHVGIREGQLGKVPLSQISLQEVVVGCVCVCVCFSGLGWGRGVGASGGSLGPLKVCKHPRGAHQQAAHRLVGEELGGHDKVPVGRMLVVLMLCRGRVLPPGVWEGRDSNGEEPSKGTV